MKREESKMNVQDVKDPGKVDGDMLRTIFWKQAQLAEKYHHIEEEQGVGYGLLQGKPFNINETRSQELVKNFAWRVVEEITEATACSIEREKEHYFEELADALHFLTELCILVKITPDDIIKELFNQDIHPDGLVALCFVKIIPPDAFPTIQELGLAMNCLKQKPWKVTHVLTDEKKFRRHIIYAYHELIAFWVRLGSNMNEIYSYYFKKNKVNQFRIESKY